MHIPLYTLDWWKLNLASIFQYKLHTDPSHTEFFARRTTEIYKKKIRVGLFFILFRFFLFFQSLILSSTSISHSILFVSYVYFLCFVSSVFEIPLFDMHFQVHAANQSLTKRIKINLIFIFQYSCDAMWCGVVNVERYAHLRWNNHPFPCRSFPLRRHSFLRDYLNDCCLRPLCRLLVAYACVWCDDFGTIL